jgi:endonuclease YncB( thermonuclease family)
LKAFIALAIFLLTCSVGWATDRLQVVDGDTIDIEGVRYRLHGIDAPEAGQKCKTATGGEWSCGKAAISEMEMLVLGRAVKCDSRGLDGYNRIIAVCKVNGHDVNEAMVRSGMAWAFQKYSDDYVAIERQARQTGLGIWQAPSQTAWDYRAEKWVVAKQQAPEGCPIKGNISKSGKIYHAPWSPWYSKTKVSIDRGEKWFCDEAEATRAGWRAPYWGRGTAGGHN